ncbi:hypothetical protein D3870_21010 [Noviherbaspirillum cavernae]|uniref:Uncharacterized protein n=1 Tax=Noviherbaspirillum cavernae TaxID=2320862 RepID=A0A418WVY6_9BURK|nr:hypothetical protein [Noviherbaspirillum cavernae]RJF96865.1 hypothetical protein D3870_21010 [Noviherbaspirillum cavernae]
MVNFVIGRHQPIPAIQLEGKPAPNAQAVTADVVTELEAQLNRLELLRPFGNGSHPTYLVPNDQNPSCCDHIDPERNDAANSIAKDTPLNKNEIAALRDFAADVGKQIAKKPLDAESTGYLKTIQRYAETMLARENGGMPVRHDLNILVSETLAEIIGKLAKHPNSTEASKDAVNLLQALGKHFPDYLKSSEYRKFFFGDGQRKLPSSSLVGKIAGHLNRANEAAAMHEDPALRAKAAYRESAAIVLSMKKPAQPPTRIVGNRVDHHNHMNPYDNFGEHSKFTPLAWHVPMYKKFSVDGSDSMPIPHQLVEQGPHARDPASLNDHTRFAYYDDTNVRAEFYSHDLTHIEAFNALPEGERELFRVCCTGTPVDPNRLNEVAHIARQFAKNVATSQLSAGRKHIGVDFGEITGYKPAVPQAMLGHAANGKKAIQQAFIEGSALVQTTIFRHAQEGIKLALKQHKHDGKSLDGIRTKTRIVFHADALPNDAATDKMENRKGDGTLKEATTIANIVAYAKQVDKALTRKKDPDFPQEVVHEHHLQAAHLMGASIQAHNYKDSSRATELHKAFNDFRENCKSLRVTTDSSWLTASARAINWGMAEFFAESDNADIREIGRLIKTADRLSNDGFMFMHGGERFFETHLLQGVTSDESLLDMALMRAAQKKAVRTYHATLGELQAKLEVPAILNQLHKYIDQGVIKPGADLGDGEEFGMVLPGNYPGLFLKLRDAKNKGIQDATPIVWGTDNLTPAEARSGDLKVLQYTSQHAPLELILAAMSKDKTQPQRTARQTDLEQALQDYLRGTQEDLSFLGSRTPIPVDDINNGTEPTRANENPRGKPNHPDTLRNVRAPQDPHFPWKPESGKTISVRVDDPGPAMNVVPGKERKNQVVKGVINALSGGFALQSYQRGSGKPGDHVTNKHLEQRINELMKQLESRTSIESQDQLAPLWDSLIAAKGNIGRADLRHTVDQLAEDVKNALRNRVNTQIDTTPFIDEASFLREVEERSQAAGVGPSHT